MKLKLPDKAVLCLLLCCTLTFNLFAQDGNKEKIAGTLTDYFKLERENIHVQFDKSIFFTNEDVWFRGYVFHRKKNLPFFTTINVYAALLDSNGKILNSKLVYANLGSFSGKFELGSKLPSGTYYLQVYTNWMNNFSEDESFVHKITVVNQDDDPAVVLNPKEVKAYIAINPEGGNYVAGVANVMGISITGDGRKLTVADAEVVDEAGAVIQKVQINRFGYGRFTLPPTQAKLTLRATVNGRKVERPFPAAAATGLAMEINNYGLAGKTIVILRMGAAMKSALAAGPLYMVIHQDEKASVIEVPLTGSEITLPVAETEFSEGVNTIRILDSKFTELASRVVYQYPKETLSSDISVTKADYEAADLKGFINYPNMSLSASILPGTAGCIDESYDIYTSLRLKPYLAGEERVPGKYFFSSLSKARHYELDLFLLNQKTKYEWSNILNNPPKDAFAFEHGLTLKGKLGTSVPDRAKYKVRMFSFIPPMNEFTGVNENNEFEINNLIIDDSTQVHFSLMKAGDKNPQVLNLSPQIVNGRQKYFKMYDPAKHMRTDGIAIPNNEQQAGFTKPKIAGGEIELEEIKIEKKALRYANSFGNGNLRGYKISEHDENVSRTLLNYIKTYGGFEVHDQGGNVTILSRTQNSINGGHSKPIIYLDNRQLWDYSMLSMIQMSEVDEIYMSSTAIVPSVNNFMGVIRVYLRKGVRIKKKDNTPEIIVRDGFAKWVEFENITYGSYADEGYKTFGVVDWEPNLRSNEAGEFFFSIPVTGQKEVKILLEGFSADGRLISEIKTITLK